MHGEAVTGHEEHPAPKNLPCAGRAGAPAWALAAFGRFQRGLADPAARSPLPALHRKERRGEERGSARGSAGRAPAPGPGGQAVRRAPRPLCCPAPGFVPQPGRGPALHLAGGGEQGSVQPRQCPVDKPCLLENVGPAPQAGALRWCGTVLGSCLQRVLPAGRVRRGTGQPGLWQHAGAEAERGTMAVTTSATSLASAGCWSWAGAAGLGRAGPGRGLQAETPPVSPACRCPSLQHPKQQRRAERGQVGRGARPSQPRRPQALSPVLSLRR